MPPWVIFFPHHFLTARRSKPPSYLQFGIQSHSLSSFQAFKATISPFFGVQSRLFTIVAFKVVILILQFGIQSHQLVWHSDSSTVWHSKPLVSLAFRAIGQFGVQSHRSHPQFKHSKPHSSVWHSKSSFTVWHSEPFVSRIQSRLSQFGIQSHWSAWHSEPPYFVRQAFRAISPQSGFQSYLLQLRHSEPSLPIQAFRVTLLSSTLPSLSIQSHFFQFSIQSHCSQLGVQSHRRSKPPSQIVVQSYSLGIQSHLSHLGVQCHFFQFSIQSHCSQLGVQSHRRSKTPSQIVVQSYNLGIQSHFAQFHLTQFRRSDPLSTVRHLESFL